MSDTRIHPTALVDPAATLGEDVEIGPYCVVSGPVSLGARTRLIAHVHVSGHTTLGADAEVHPFSAIGGPAQDRKHKGEVVRLTIGDRCVIREHVTMHAGTAAEGGETRVGHDGYFMVGAHVAHDCVIGDNVTFANNASLGGCCVLGDRVNLGGLAAVHQFTRIGRYAFIAGMATVVSDVIPFGSAAGNWARLAGLNLIGLKRGGFSREAIDALRTSYKTLASDEGLFKDRVARVEAEIAPGSSEVQEVVDFIRAPAKRPLCTP